MPVYNGIYYEVYGTGKPLVLTNGIMMNTNSWKWHISEFSKYFKVIVFDFYDQGKSMKIEGNYTIEKQVEGMVSLLEHLNSGPYNIVGLSYGGQITLKLAINKPEIVDKLVISNTTAKVGNFLRAVGDIWEYTTKIKDPVVFYKLSLPFIYGKTFYEENLKFLEERKELFKKALTEEWFESLYKLISTNQTFDVSKEIYKIKNPTLLISGSEDVITPHSEMLELKNKIKNSELVCVENAGHGLFLEKKELWVSLIKGFII